MSATIQELMADIRNLDLVLPEFQREYVWNLEQAKQLIVSLFKGYPTGSLLFWKTATPPELKNTNPRSDKIGTTKVILDGQQRLTTLYLLIKNKIPPYYQEKDIVTDPRELYFDLETGELLYYQVTRMKNNPTWLPVTECLATPCPVQVIKIAQQKVSPEQFQQFAQRYIDNLNKLRSLLDRDYPVQVVPATADIDEAIDIFDRVNSLGTKLTDAELALTHMTGKWPQARKVMKAKLRELELKGFEFDLTFMVRSLVSVVHSRALYEIIHSTTYDQLLNGWEKLSRILDYLVAILSGHAFIHSTDDLNTTNVLVPLVAYLGQHGEKFPDTKEMKHAIHWMYAASIWSRYAGQTDQNLDHDISVIQRQDNPWSELLDAIIKQRGRIEVKPSDLEGRGIQHPLYRMMFVTAKANGAVDWFNGQPLSVPLGKNQGMNNRYIFPNSLLYKYHYNSQNYMHKKLIAEIANRAFLAGNTNTPLGYDEPKQFFAEIEQKYPDALTRQFVPVDPHLWQRERFEDFLVARRTLVAEAINKLMNSLIKEQKQRSVLTLDDMLSIGESAILEFKSSLRWDLKMQKFNSEMQKMVFKTIASFLNVEGGTLLIGVADDGTVLGIEYDLSHKVQVMGAQDRDKYAQLFQSSSLQFLGAEFAPYMHLSFKEHSEHTVAIVEVEACPKPVYLKDKNHSEFYIRAGNTSKLLDVEEAHNYIGMHWEL